MINGIESSLIPKAGVAPFLGRQRGLCMKDGGSTCNRCDRMDGSTVVGSRASVLWEHGL